MEEEKEPVALQPCQRWAGQVDVTPPHPAPAATSSAGWKTRGAVVDVRLRRLEPHDCGDEGG
eukprot:1021869-Alexandrium_andersonii.AAC.1